VSHSIHRHALQTAVRRVRGVQSHVHTGQIGSTMLGMPLAQPAQVTYDSPSPTRSESQEIERLIADGSTTLRFPPHLESRFMADSAGERLRTMLLSGVLVAVMFNWMLLSDWLMVPDQFALALQLRLFVFTPVTMLGLLGLSRVRAPVAREWAAFATGVGAALINTILCVQSHDALAGPYLVSLATIVMFSSAVAQMRFVQAALMDGIIIVMFMGATNHIPEAPSAVMIPAGLVLLSTITFTLYSSYCQERDERLNWLLHLRERLLLDDLAHANQHLADASRSDVLTGIANRRHFDEHLHMLWERARADGSDMSLMMIDVDHLKDYNDRYGHAAGDACLKEVALVLKRRLRRPGDLVARFGGEEFIAVMAGTSISTAIGAAERVRQGIEDLSASHAASGAYPQVTVSIGVACLRPNSPLANSAQLIAAADEALYQAKIRGRNRVFAFGTSD